jgi:hypothetical protein
MNTAYQNLLDQYEEAARKADAAIDAHSLKITQVRYYLQGTEEELARAKAEKFAAMSARDEVYRVLRSY